MSMSVTNKRQNAYQVITFVCLDAGDWEMIVLLWYNSGMLDRQLWSLWLQLGPQYVGESGDTWNVFDQPGSRKSIYSWCMS